MDTLTALRDNAFQAFEKIFLDIQLKSQSSITARTAANIATEMSTGLYSQLYGQVDPLHIGEAARAMSIALHYGARLLENGRNVNSENLGTLISEYPSHEFVIDRREVEKLFNNVRDPSHNELLLGELLGDKAKWPYHTDNPAFEFLSSELSPEEGDESEVLEGVNNETVSKSESTGSGNSVETTPEQPA